MTLAQARLYAEAASSIETDRVRAMAVAMRAAQADAKDWKRWMDGAW